VLSVIATLVLKRQFFTLMHSILTVSLNCSVLRRNPVILYFDDIAPRISEQIGGASLRSGSDDDPVIILKISKLYY